MFSREGSVYSGYTAHIRNTLWNHAINSSEWSVTESYSRQKILSYALFAHKIQDTQIYLLHPHISRTYILCIVVSKATHFHLLCLSFYPLDGLLSWDPLMNIELKVILSSNFRNSSFQICRKKKIRNLVWKAETISDFLVRSVSNVIKLYLLQKLEHIFTGK